MKHLFSKIDSTIAMLVAFVLILVAAALWASPSDLVGITLATQSIFSFTSRANPNLLSRRAYLQQWRDHPFGKFVAPEFVKGNTGKDTSESNLPQPGDAKFTGAPIEVFEEFIKMGKTDMDIPVRNRLTGLPVHGDKPVKGTGERSILMYRSVQINYTRKAYNPPTGMSLQIVKDYADQVAFNADEQLRTWLNDYHPGNFILSMCTGYSRDLLMPSASGGRAETIISHPHFYTAGAGKVSYGGGRPGSAGYEASVEAAVNGLTDTAGDYMSLQFLKNLKIEAIRNKIAPVLIKGGHKFFMVWITDAQWVQLQNDADWKDFYKRIPEPFVSHPVVTGAVAMYDGMCIYVDQDLFAAHTNANSGGVVTAGKVWYGPLPTSAEAAAGITVGNFIEDIDTGDVKVGFIVGASALSVGVGVPQGKDGRFGSKIQYTDLVDDHGFVQEIAISMIQSVVRNDIFDRDGYVLTAGDFYENTSSLAFATYSPQALSWS